MNMVLLVSYPYSLLVSYSYSLLVSLITISIICRALCPSFLEAFTLPSYAKDMAAAYSTTPSPASSPLNGTFNPSVEQFMDVEDSERDASEEYRS